MYVSVFVMFKVSEIINVSYCKDYNGTFSLEIEFLIEIWWFLSVMFKENYEYGTWNRVGILWKYFAVAESPK